MATSTLLRPLVIALGVKPHPVAHVSSILLRCFNTGTFPLQFEPHLNSLSSSIDMLKSQTLNMNFSGPTTSWEGARHKTSAYPILILQLVHSGVKVVEPLVPQVVCVCQVEPPPAQVVARAVPGDKLALGVIRVRPREVDPLCRTVGALAINFERISLSCKYLLVL